MAWLMQCFRDGDPHCCDQCNEFRGILVAPEKEDCLTAFMVGSRLTKRHTPGARQNKRVLLPLGHVKALSHRHKSPPQPQAMVEGHTVTVEWSGDPSLGTLFLAAASRPHCKATLKEHGGEANLTVQVHHTSLQELRNVVDELMIALADLEGE
jgi:hypothetical protein